VGDMGQDPLLSPKDRKDLEGLSEEEGCRETRNSTSTP
jgi:hypothetical protein